MRSEKEIRAELERLRLHRKDYLKRMGGRGDDYSRRVHHYVQCLEWVLERRERLHVAEIWEQVTGRRDKGKRQIE